ncbi:MAG: nuclear transport factor 2 family protein [Jatrophihabitantaceae bacterium]
MSDDLEKAMAEFQRCIAQRDQDGAGRILDEHYALVLVHPIRTEVPRELWLSNLPDYVVHSYDVQERFIDIDGDCAVVLHRANMTATVNGVDRSGLFVISDIWRMRDGRWRVWRRHSTPLSAGPMPS